MPARSPIERIVTANQAMLKVCRDVEKLAGDQRSGAAAGRKRHRQGGAGAGAARPWAAREAAVRRHQLRRDPGEPAGKRAVRPRARRLHRRGEADHRQDRKRQSRARCSSTKSATCRIRCRSSCCASCRTRSSSGSAGGRRSRSMCASSRRPTPTWRTKISRGHRSAAICSTA